MQGSAQLCRSDLKKEPTGWAPSQRSDIAEKTGNKPRQKYYEKILAMPMAQ